jgi:hypothetical protein
MSQLHLLSYDVQHMYLSAPLEAFIGESPFRFSAPIDEGLREIKILVEPRQRNEQGNVLPSDFADRYYAYQIELEDERLVREMMMRDAGGSAYGNPLPPPPPVAGRAQNDASQMATEIFRSALMGLIAGSLGDLQDEQDPPEEEDDEPAEIFREVLADRGLQMEDNVIHEEAIAVFRDALRRALNPGAAAPLANQEDEEEDLDLPPLEDPVPYVPPAPAVPPVGVQQEVPQQGVPQPAVNGPIRWVHDRPGYRYVEVEIPVSPAMAILMGALGGQYGGINIPAHLLQEDVKIVCTDAEIAQCRRMLFCELKEKLGTACNICLDDFKDDTEVMQLNGCNHYYHPDCITNWLTQNSNKCPVCRVPNGPGHPYGLDDENEEQGGIEGMSDID